MNPIRQYIVEKYLAEFHTGKHLHVVYKEMGPDGQVVDRAHGNDIPIDLTDEEAAQGHTHASKMADRLHKEGVTHTSSPGQWQPKTFYRSLGTTNPQTGSTPIRDFYVLNTAPEEEQELHGHLTQAGIIPPQ